LTILRQSNIIGSWFQPWLLKPRSRVRLKDHFQAKLNNTWTGTGLLLTDNANISRGRKSNRAEFAAQA
jgi:hypothetical protein